MPAPDDQHRSSKAGADLLTLLVCCAGVALVLALAAYFVDGKTGAEKTVTRLVLPVGAAWLLLSGWLLQRLVSTQIRRSLLPAVLWLCCTLCSTPPFVDLCTRYLESRETSFDPSVDPPLDVLVVLGGGTRQGPSRAETAQSGDRVVYAAQLFIQGHTAHLVTTGNALSSRGGQRISNLSEQTIEIWTRLGIPRDAISSWGGINTYQELQQVKSAMENELAGKRVGILTSAWHLPRAIRLGRAQGLTNLVPVAADHQGSGHAIPFAEYIPNAGTLARFSRCQHEFMARLVRR